MDYDAAELLRESVVLRCAQSCSVVDKPAKQVHLIALIGYGHRHNRERARESESGAHLGNADIQAVNQVLAPGP